MVDNTALLVSNVEAVPQTKVLNVSAVSGKGSECRILYTAAVSQVQSSEEPSTPLG